MHKGSQSFSELVGGQPTHRSAAFHDGRLVHFLYFGHRGRANKVGLILLICILAGPHRRLADLLHQSQHVIHPFFYFLRLFSQLR